MLGLLVPLFEVEFVCYGTPGLCACMGDHAVASVAGRVLPQRGMRFRGFLLMCLLSAHMLATEHLRNSDLLTVRRKMSPEVCVTAGA